MLIYQYQGPPVWQEEEDEEALTEESVADEVGVVTVSLKEDVVVFGV